MFEEILTILSEVFSPDELERTLDPSNFIAQAIAVVVVFLLAMGLQIIFRWVLRPGKKYIPDTRLSNYLLTIGKYVALPITVLLLLYVTIGFYIFYYNGAGILQAVGRAVMVWVVYEFVRAILDVSMDREHARFWGRKVLLPVAAVAAFFNALDLLDNILELGVYFEAIGVTITVGTVLLGIGILVVFLILARWVRELLLHSSIMAESGMEPSLTITIAKVTSYGIIVVGLLIAMGSIGIDMSTLTVILGGLSVGLAFGLQDIVNNFISGFILLLERSIEPGDVVEVTNNTGVVKTVGVRSTTVTTRDNVELIIPNSLFLTEIVTNMTHTDELVRARVGVGVSYNCNPRQVQQILLNVADQHTDVLPDPAPTVQFKEFGDSSLNFELLVWTDKAIQSVVLGSELRFRIWDALAENSIEIPFPQRDIHIRSGVPWDQLAQKPSSLPAQEE